MQMTASFPTMRASALLGTMSKHFAHKITVIEEEDCSTLHFEMGEAGISVTPEGLHLTLNALDPDAMERLRGVVEGHLLRFAHREDPAPLAWTAAG
ncbi:DUF2218 domain-containing protein [Paracoccus sp. (in: a-proteobacteria)]|uniref:DUF2218 domain-containing protein n=1 Tax=Paracoccus sp. TaxID=267 RepID=UPI00396CAD3A